MSLHNHSAKAPDYVPTGARKISLKLIVRAEEQGPPWSIQMQFDLRPACADAVWFVLLPKLKNHEAPVRAVAKGHWQITLDAAGDPQPAEIMNLPMAQAAGWFSSTSQQVRHRTMVCIFAYDQKLTVLLKHHD